ncbi:MAG: SMC-Scp complex subunit ScpB [Bacilli bacterium]|jgi:segregation and condensation protein B|nr:SMC-Scp complex subunit ScpB [Bacilli bacterium]
MNYIAILEGILFLVGENGVTIKTIVNTLELNENEVYQLLDEYQNELENDNRGLSLLKYGDKYKLTTKKEYFSFYQKLASNPLNFTFSNAALETMAIIAYKQPLTRLEIEQIRGVNSDGIIKKLLLKGLIKIAGYKDSVGHPTLYSVTEEFLDIFNLTSLDELPDFSQIIVDEEQLDIFNTRFSDEENNEEDGVMIND